MKTTLAVSCVALALALGGAFATFWPRHPRPPARPPEVTRLAIDAPAPDPAAFAEGAPTLVIAARQEPRPDRVVLFWEAPIVTVKARRPARAQIARAHRHPPPRP